MEHSSRRTFLTQVSAFALATGTRSSLWAAPTDSLVFAGTYTDKTSTSHGIYAFHWDADAGTLEPLGLAVATSNPSFLALSPDRRYLYAVNEVDKYRRHKSGSVSSFEVQGSKLKPINVVPSGGTGPCKVTTDHTGKAVFVANYDSGSAASYHVLSNGALSKPVTILKYTGHGADPDRQATPHAHCTTVSPDNRYVLVNDLGLDRISVYRLEAPTAWLTPNAPPFYEALPKSGPRSFAFHPTGRWAYSLNEIANTLDTLAWDAENGVLTRIQNISTLPQDFKGEDTAAQVAVDSAGRFVYASNRGDDSIAVFKVNDKDGTLKVAQHISCGGKGPRHFALDPGNQWLLVANQDTGNIVVFARNAHTGMLTASGNQYPLSAAVCLAFL